MLSLGPDINEQGYIASDARMMNEGYQNKEPDAMNMGNVGAIRFLL